MVEEECVRKQKLKAFNILDIRIKVNLFVIALCFSCFTNLSVKERMVCISYCAHCVHFEVLIRTNTGNLLDRTPVRK